MCVCGDFLYTARLLICVRQSHISEIEAWTVFNVMLWLMLWVKPALEALTFPILLSFDYENAGYQPAELIKMDILLNGKPVEELAMVVHK